MGVTKLQESVVEMSQGGVAQIINNTIFGEIDNLLSQGRDMDYIARHYHMDLALAWALRLGGKSDQEKLFTYLWTSPITLWTSPIHCLGLVFSCYL